MTKARRKQLRTIYLALDTLAERAGVSNLFADAYRAELKSEREHRAMGARFTDGTARYRVSCAVAAELFVCKWVLEGAKKPAGWLQTCQVRDAARLGYAVHEAIAALISYSRANKLAPACWPTGFDFDYCEDIVGES